MRDVCPVHEQGLEKTESGGKVDVVHFGNRTTVGGVLLSG
jgi:hypothetical protein